MEPPPTQRRRLDFPTLQALAERAFDNAVAAPGFGRRILQIREEVVARNKEDPLAYTGPPTLSELALSRLGLFRQSDKMYRQMRSETRRLLAIIDSFIARDDKWNFNGEDYSLSQFPFDADGAKLLQFTQHALSAQLNPWIGEQMFAKVSFYEMRDKVIRPALPVLGWIWETYHRELFTQMSLERWRKDIYRTYTQFNQVEEIETTVAGYLAQVPV